MELVKMDLISKNNKKNNFYLYIPIVKKDNKFFKCKSIKSEQPIRTYPTDKLIITNEILPEFYKANRLI